MQPPEIALHVRNFLHSRQIGFQPTQMLPIADTELSGNLQHLDLPGVMQMLAQARQTGALHINAGVVDGIIFFDAGELSHAEYEEYFGDEAVCEIVRSCYGINTGVYKFMYGVMAAQRTVLRSATDLMLDAMREVDEANLAADSVNTLAEVPARRRHAEQRMCSRISGRMTRHMRRPRRTLRSSATSGNKTPSA